MKDKYSVVIQWSKEDKGYIATIPEFSGLSAFGVSKEEAVKEIEIAKEAFLEVYEEDGCELPEPDTLCQFSGQTRLRLPKTLHASLSRKAKAEGVSLNTYIVHLLSERNIGHRIERKIDSLEDSVQDLYRQPNVVAFLQDVESGPEGKLIYTDVTTGSDENYFFTQTDTHKRLN